MKRIKTGWHLTGKSWGVLRSNKTLMWFPVLAGISSMIAVALIFVPATAIFVVGESATVAKNGADSTDNSWQIVFGIASVIAAYISTIITIYFNVALASCAIKIFSGEETSFREGLSMAWSRKWAILGWAIVTTTVGLLIRAIAERLGPVAGTILAVLGGFAWAVASWFVVPSLAIDGLGPWQSLKKSASTVRERWGEGVTGIVTIGGVVFLAVLAFLPIAIVVGILLASVSVAAVAIWALISLLVLIGLGIISSAMRQIFNAAIYMLTQSEEDISAGPFTSEDVNNAVVQR